MGEKTAQEKVQESLAPRQRESVGKTLYDLLKRNRSAITACLRGDALEADRLIRVAFNAVSRNEMLLKCDPLSVVLAVRKAAEYRLDLTAGLNQAAIVPRWNGRTKRNEADFQLMYGGQIELAMRGGKVAAIRPRVVYDCDHFEVHEGTEARIIHRPSLQRPADAQLVAVYAIAEFPAGPPSWVVLLPPDIERHRASSSTWRAKQDGKLASTLWDTATDAMWLKTAIHVLAKYLPRSTCPELATATAEEASADRDQSIDVDFTIDQPPADGPAQE